MTAQPIPAFGRDDSGFPRPRTGSYGTVISGGTVVSDGTVTAGHTISGVLPRQGESDPSRMLSGVLLLVMATVIMALTLAWWLV